MPATGYRIPEFDLFGADFAARYARQDQQVSELRRLWADGGLTPAPVRERLPIWLGYQGPKGARRAGRMGEGLLTLAKTSWPHYRDGLAEAGHDEVTARMAGGIQAYVTDDPERDWPRVAPHIAYAQDSYRRYMVEGTPHPVPRPVDPERLRTKGPDAGPMSYFLFGQPEQVAKEILACTGDAPVQTVWLDASIAGLPEDLAQQGIRCNAISPGFIIIQEKPGREALEASMLRHHVTPRLGRPADIAALVVFLASDEAQFITGQNICVDGGLLAHQPFLADFR